MDIDRVLEESNDFAEQLLELIELPLIDISQRMAAAYVACSLALEHWHSVRLQLAAELLPSAVVVHRAQFEALVRSIWLAHCASESEVGKLTDTLDLESEQVAKSIASTQRMMEDIAKSAPAPAHAALARFKDNSWKVLNSYAHAGIHPLRRHVEGYPVALALNVLRNSNGLAGLSGMQAVVLCGRQPLQKQVRDLASKYPSCMPPPL